MKSAWPAIAILLLAQAGLTAAATPLPQQSQQSDTSSLAAAARRAREEKKDQPKPAHVWDNDTIPKQPGAISVIGPGSAAPADDSTTTPSDANPAAADSAANSPVAADESAPEKSSGDKLAAEIAAIQSDLAAARAQLKTAKADLDLVQRKYTLDSQMYYGKPNYAADKDGAASLDAEKADLEAKQQAVADAQMKVDQLEAKLSSIR